MACHALVTAGKIEAPGEWAQVNLAWRIRVLYF
jgi:hypothetical protein